MICLAVGEAHGADRRAGAARGARARARPQLLARARRPAGARRRRGAARQADRRGSSTARRTAMLAGDALLAEAFRLAARTTPARRARARAGDARDDRRPVPRHMATTPDHATLHRLKTGCLFYASVGDGAVGGRRAGGRAGPWRAFARRARPALPDRRRHPRRRRLRRHARRRRRAPARRRGGRPCRGAARARSTRTRACCARSSTGSQSARRDRAVRRAVRARVRRRSARSSSRSAAGLREWDGRARRLRASTRCAGPGAGRCSTPWPNRIDGRARTSGTARRTSSRSTSRAGNAIHGLVRWASWRAVERETRAS